jgi:hypothetical protein
MAAKKNGKREINHSKAHSIVVTSLKLQNATPIINSMEKIKTMDQTIFGIKNESL